MDDFFDLPDESKNPLANPKREGPPLISTFSSSNLVNQNIFGDLKKSATSNAPTFESILASVPKSTNTGVGAGQAKKPIVTFQEPALETEIDKADVVSKQQTANRTIVPPPAGGSGGGFETAASSNPSSTSGYSMSGGMSSLIDSLFPTRNFNDNSASAKGRGFDLPSLPEGGQKMPGRSAAQQIIDVVARKPMAPTASGTSAQPATLSTDSIMATKDRELEEYRREVSTLRYENAESAKMVETLQRKLENALEDGQRTVNNLHQQYRDEIAELKRKHDREIESTRNEFDRNAEILRAIKQQENLFCGVDSEMKRIFNTLAQFANTLRTIGEDESRVETVVSFAEKQIQSSVEALQKEKVAFDQRQREALQKMDAETVRVTQLYEAEIVRGREWLEDERRRLGAERQAFQEEQIKIIAFLEQKKEELDQNKNEFLTKEHDLLIRVVNEKALLEERRREFDRQKNADVNRLRGEALYLERTLRQIDATKQALLKTKRRYEMKNQQLGDIKEMVLEYERQIRRQSYSKACDHQKQPLAIG